MRRLFLFAILTFFLTSCASTGLRRDIPGHQLSFFDESPAGQSRAYREYKTLAPGEKARISYLLWRMEYSPLKFWRNGSKYNGREGAGWLRWKMRKFYPHVHTVEEFISEVATRSENSQIPYKIYCLAYDCPHNLRDVLLSELHALDEYEQLMAKEEEARVQEEALKALMAVEAERKDEILEAPVAQVSEVGPGEVVTEKPSHTTPEPVEPASATQEENSKSNEIPAVEAERVDEHSSQTIESTAPADKSL